MVHPDLSPWPAPPGQGLSLSRHSLGEQPLEHLSRWNPAEAVIPLPTMNPDLIPVTGAACGAQVEIPASLARGNVVLGGAAEGLRRGGHAVILGLLVLVLHYNTSAIRSWMLTAATGPRPAH